MTTNTTMFHDTKCVHLHVCWRSSI